jgi:ATP-dependent Clp protease ATP-binding subunit ClpA
MYDARLLKETQDILKSATAEACALGNEFVASEHVLIAIAKSPSERLLQYSLNPEIIVAEAHKLNPVLQESREISTLPFSPLLERVVQSTMQRQGSIEDLFYGLIADGDSLACTILGNLGYSVAGMLEKHINPDQ